MDKDDIKKSSVDSDNQWQAPGGHVYHLCVPCELNPRIENSTQSSVVFLGASLCLRHLKVVQAMQTSGYADIWITGLMTKGEL